MKVQPDGCLILMLPPPRGCFSALVLIIAGAFSFVLLSFIFLLQVSDNKPVPGEFKMTAAVSSVVFLIVLIDRMVAQGRGLKIRFVKRAQELRYEVLYRGRIVQENFLESSGLFVGPLALPGQIGCILAPAYALFLTLDEDVPGYTVAVEDKHALVLISATNLEALGSRIEMLYLALGLD